ncbi:hypothetical protein C1X59_05945 [Pseudomonas sp. FW215-R2]|nr:hypothetical protein C1X59_05945 [Pseudomonas sp. FW215-R2]PMX25543.1 hypothetical protein C1X57_03455 [Pseudomonas sp. FW215-E1]PNA32545.1 hypothetical protein C1X58_02935 [Pseudomonas sp. FW215-R4]
MKKAPSGFKIAVGSRDPAAPLQTKAVFSKLRITLHVPNVFEGDYEIVHYDTSTLSIIVAEMDAKKTFRA